MDWTAFERADTPRLDLLTNDRSYPAAARKQGVGLFAIQHKLGIAFYAHSVLARSFLSKMKDPDAASEGRISNYLGRMDANSNYLETLSEEEAIA